MTRLLTPEAVNVILHDRLSRLYSLIGQYSKEHKPPPLMLVREASAIEARIYEESYATEILEGG